MGDGAVHAVGGRTLAADTRSVGFRREVAGVTRASDRFSIRKRVKLVCEDEPADVEAAERLFARLCARMLLAEQQREQSREQRPELPEEDQ